IRMTNEIRNPKFERRKRSELKSLYGGKFPHGLLAHREGCSLPKRKRRRWPQNHRRRALAGSLVRCQISRCCVLEHVRALLREAAAVKIALNRAVGAEGV